MKHIPTCLSLAAFAAAMLAASSASAEYRCAPPPTRTDRLACEAAQQGPEELSRLTHRMRVVENLHFPDYVNNATLIAWEQKELAERERTRAEALARAADERR
jgi:hypothetical protein